MSLRITLRAGLPVLVTAAAFCATEVWNTKDPSVWTTEDANVVLNNSPWAKQIKLAPQGMGQRRPGGMGRRGGGMGYPGGGYPGGGYPGGGGGYPGGGGGYPGGGGRGGSGGTDGISLPASATVRWESAKPVEEAEARLNSLNASYNSRPDEQADAKSAKAETKPSDHYVIALLGIRVPGSRNRDDDETGTKSRNTKAYDQFMSNTQLVIKNKTPLSPDNVKFINDRGQSEIQFFFPKTSPITAADKEVTFQTMVGRVKVENKFNLKKMTRNGKLELD